MTEVVDWHLQAISDWLFPLTTYDVYVAGAVFVVVGLGTAITWVLARSQASRGVFATGLAAYVLVSWVMLQLPDVARNRYVGTPDEGCLRYIDADEPVRREYELKGFPQRVKLDEPYVDASGTLIRYGTEVMLFNREVWGEYHHLCRFPYDDAARRWEANIAGEKARQGAASKEVGLEFGERPIGRIMVKLPGLDTKAGELTSAPTMEAAREARTGRVGEMDGSEGGAHFIMPPDNPARLPMKPPAGTG